MALRVILPKSFDKPPAYGRGPFLFGPRKARPPQILNFVKRHYDEHKFSLL